MFKNFFAKGFRQNKEDKIENDRLIFTIVLQALTFLVQATQDLNDQNIERIVPSSHTGVIINFYYICSVAFKLI